MVLFIYGEDSWQSRQYLRQVTEQFKHKVDPQGLNVMTVDGSELTVESFRNVAVSSNLWAGRRLVIIKNLLAAKITTELAAVVAEIIKQQSGEAVSLNVLVFYETGVPDQRTALFKLLAKQPRVKKFDPLTPAQAVKWAQAYAAKLGATLPGPAANVLVAAVGGQGWLLANELAKLASFKHGQTIAAEDVKTQISEQAAVKIFDLTDALGGQQSGRALQLLKNLLETDEEPLYILAMLSRQLRLISLAKDAAGPGAASFGQQQKLPPFVATKLMAQSKLFSWDRLRAAYQTLVQADLDLKNSSLPGPAVLTKLIATI